MKIIGYILFTYNALGQNVITTLKKSNTTWTSDIELDNGVNEVKLEDGSITTNKNIVIRSKVLNLSNFKIACDKLIFETNVDNINVDGMVAIEAKTVVFKLAAGGTQELKIAGLNSAASKLCILYTSALLNSRKLKLEIDGGGQVSFYKK